MGKGEINRDFYCSAHAFKADKRKKYPGMCKCTYSGRPCGTAIMCLSRHRKWPTPEQFREEYGFEWTGAVYTKCKVGEGRKDDCPAWYVREYDEYLKKGTCVDYTRGNCNYCGGDTKRYIICACTPFGHPPNDWSPEEMCKANDQEIVKPLTMAEEFGDGLETFNNGFYG